VELALVRSYSFLMNDPYRGALARLAATIRGLGHPLIAAYARAYWTKKVPTRTYPRCGDSYCKREETRAR